MKAKKNLKLWVGLAVAAAILLPLLLMLGQRLEAALDRLPEGMRSVLILHDVEGYTHEEIARKLGKSRPVITEALSHSLRGRVVLDGESADAA